jgi:hypothetical protein
MSDPGHSFTSCQGLAQVLAVEISSAEEIAKLNKDLRWEGQEQSFLSACSSLIAVVDLRDSRVVYLSLFPKSFTLDKVLGFRRARV